jgi:hypothetical protein
MDHFVSLEKWPEGVEFPPELRDRIEYNAATRRLTFHGFMSKSDFDRLCRLSDDWGYRRPLEELFQQSTLAEEQPRSPLRRVMSSLASLWTP